MSAVVGVFGAHGTRVDDELVQRMLGAMRARGSDYSAVWQQDGAMLAVTRNSWELAPELSGDALVIWDDDLVVAADASLYYRGDLRAKLAARNAAPAGGTSAHLILAAYRLWRDDCVHHLEGDHAFVVWDRRARRVFGARDFAGSRPLFCAEFGDSLLIASSLAALRAHPGCPPTLNAVHLAETAANLWTAPEETACAAVRAIPPGHSISLSRPGVTRVVRYWRPAPITSRRAAPFADAAAELRDRLGAAVAERLAPQVTSVWMSGGRDSTAVFAAGQAAASATLHPISVSYPPGDSGREDELINAVAEYWQTPVHWIDSQQIPFFDEPQRRAAARDEPYEPSYATLNRALARGSRAVGARIALDGWGGDQLFQMSLMHFADLFRSGRWIALAREWRMLGARDGRFFFRTAITPVLPPLLRTLAKALRGGRPLTADIEPWIPPWTPTGWADVLIERQRQHRMTQRRRSFADYELELFLTSATVGRVRGRLSALALEEGIEVRSPLYDARIVELAVGRPENERRHGRDTKMLLRAAMRGLLPDHVLAPRKNRTGITESYAERALRAAYPVLLDEVFAAPIVLAELGVVDAAEWRRWADACFSSSFSNKLAIALVSTLQTELWLRGVRDYERDSPGDGRSLAVLQPGERPGTHTPTRR